MSLKKLAVLAFFLTASQAYGTIGEVSFTGSFSKTDYGNNTYSTTRRLVGAAAYNLTPVTQIELSYTDTRSFFNYDPVQTSLVTEQILAASVVQNLVPSNWVIQPYAKGGAAQYNRQQRGTTAGVPTKPVETKSPSFVAGAGARIFLYRGFSLKMEAVTYLPDFNFSQAQNNFAVTLGVGAQF